MALVQHSPVFLNLAASIDKAEKLIRTAVSNKAEVVVFPETWLPGYPVWLDNAEKAALWDHTGAKALFRLLFKNSLEIGSPLFLRMEQMANETGIVLVMGCHERDGNTLYNTMIFFPGNGGVVQIHRKLMPTYNEKLIWGQGDGSTLSTMESKGIVIGGLICWEHWMPLARAAMHAQTEHIHVAQWPSVIELHQVASRHYAFEGNCFVLACGSVMLKQDVMQGFDSLNADEPEARQMLDTIAVKGDHTFMSGGSCVIGPDAQFVTPPLFNEETIVYADLDLESIYGSNLVMDTDGHYARPDVFSLSVDTTPRQNVTFTKGK